MRNRSISGLPSFYVPYRDHLLDNTEECVYSLKIFQINYLHFHSQMELGVCRRGEGVCMVEGREYPFRQGDVQIIFPFQSHLSRSVGQTSEWVWANVDPIRLLSQWGAPDLPRLERLLNTGMGLYGILDREKYPLCCELIRRIVLPGERKTRIACLNALIEELAQQSKGLPALSLRPGRAFLQLEPALQLVQKSMQEGNVPPVSDLARACSLSDPAFRRSFHQVMGQSPQEYILSCRMSAAQRLLILTDKSVTQVAFEAGYQDVSGFNRQFLQSFGLSPRTYRKEMRKELSENEL